MIGPSHVDEPGPPARGDHRGPTPHPRVTGRAARTAPNGGTNMDDFTDVDAYLDASERWPREIGALRPLLLAAGLDERIRWGKPCYSHGDANIAILQEFVDDLALMFFKGILLDDPSGVLEEVGPNSHAARRVTFTSVEEIEARADVVSDLLREAIAVEDAGTEVPPRPAEELAPELAERLEQDPELAAAFDRLTPGRQREYNLHVAGAKQASTRERRVDAIVPRILDGRGLRDR
jgi:uncharacterized protein YdeI (YjbR/CyaY-like superfamily)